MGRDVLTEKPLTTDERKCQAILDAERASNKKLIVGFNYRWSPYATRIKELLAEKPIGKITAVDFHWYLNTYHGASFFRRWHGLRQSSGTLLVHKATHHFDLLNWWIDSDPAEVFAYGALQHYGGNGPYQGDKCRICQHKGECRFYRTSPKMSVLCDCMWTMNNEGLDQAELHAAEMNQNLEDEVKYQPIITHKTGNLIYFNLSYSIRQHINLQP